MAGHIPKNKPMLTETTKPMTTDQRGTAEGSQGPRARIKKAERHARKDAEHATRCRSGSWLPAGIAR